MKKMNFAKVYSYDKICRYKSDETGFEYEYTNLRAHRNNRIYATKMKHDSLPEYFCDVMRYSNRCFDVIDSRGVLNLKYKWFKMNHFMRDSSLEVTFVDDNEENIRVYAYDIFKYLAYVKKYSEYDISGVRDEFIKQCEWLSENEPDFVPKTDNFGNWFDNKINEY